MIRNVKLWQGLPHNGEYVSPEVKVVLFESEGILCSSVEGIDNEDFIDGGSYEF